MDKEASPAHVIPAPDLPKSSVGSWLAVFGASLALFCTVGFLNAFGVFQGFYTSYLHKSDSDISWIGSFSIFILYCGAGLSGVLADKFGPTALLCTGSIGQLFALFMTSLCKKYYQVFLAQSLLLGISMSLIFCPPLAVVSRRLPHRRGLALGFTIGGSSIGGVIWPIMIQQLLYHDAVSFSWTMRAVAFTMMPLLAVACLTITDPPKPPSNPESNTATAASERPKKTSDFSIFKNWTYILLCLGLGIAYLGLFTPFFYVSAYAAHIGISTNMSFYLISIINAASFFGRVLPGYWADSYGHFNLCALATFIAGVIGFCWVATSNLAGLIVWSLAYGFTSGVRFVSCSLQQNWSLI